MLMRVPPDRMPEPTPRRWRDAEGILIAVLLCTFLLTVFIVVYALSLR